MLANDRDEINYHKFMKSMRTSQNISLEKLGLGIYKKSAMSRVEAGERLPDKLVRDRITARLGVSGEEYEEYLLPREYKQWECRMEIIRCINKKDITGAEEKIAAYANTYNSNKVDVQFPLVMQFMVMEMKGASEEELYAQICKAIDCTIVDKDKALDGLHVLADQELNLMMEYVRLRKEVVPENDLTEWKLATYKKIAVYVERSKLDEIARAKVYSKLACFVSELVLTMCENEVNIRYALRLCIRAIKLLRDTVRLYYFVEINEYRLKLIEKHRAFTKDEEESNKLDKLYHRSEQWATLFHELYTENELPVYMENFTYLYTETECNNISDVIRARRDMMGLTREKMVGYACVERTLARIEKKKTNPTMAVVRELFDRMGLCAEYKRARVITSDVEALQLSCKLIVEINSGKFLQALKTHEILGDKLDMQIVFNKQEMKRMEANILIGLKRISNEKHRDMLKDALEGTLEFDTIMKKENIYLSRSELSCVHNLALYTDGKVAEICRKYLENMCFKLLEKQELESARLGVYEIIMDQCADYLGIPLRTYQNYETDISKISTIKYEFMMQKLGEYGYIDEANGILSIEEIKKICVDIFKNFEVEYGYLFGSYAKGKATDTSDVDLLISPSVSGIRFFELTETLRESLKKKIDVLTIEQLKDNPELINEILRDGVKIYG